MSERDTKGVCDTILSDVLLRGELTQTYAHANAHAKIPQKLKYSA